MKLQQVPLDQTLPRLGTLRNTREPENIDIWPSCMELFPVQYQESILAACLKNEIFEFHRNLSCPLVFLLS